MLVPVALDSGEVRPPPVAPPGEDLVTRVGLARAQIRVLARSPSTRLADETRQNRAHVRPATASQIGRRNGRILGCQNYP